MDWKGAEWKETTEVTGVIHIMGYLGYIVAGTGGLGADGFEVYFEDRIGRDWPWTGYEDARKGRVRMTLSFMAWTTGRWG